MVTLTYICNITSKYIYKYHPNKIENWLKKKLKIFTRGEQKLHKSLYNPMVPMLSSMKCIKWVREKKVVHLTNLTNIYALNLTI